MPFLVFPKANMVDKVKANMVDKVKAKMVDKVRVIFKAKMLAFSTNPWHCLIKAVLVSMANYHSLEVEGVSRVLLQAGGPSGIQAL